MTTDTTFVDHNVTNGVEYYYMIAAGNLAGFGEPTEMLSAVPMTRPDPPGRLEVNQGNRYLELIWTPPSDTGGGTLINYTVYRGETPGNLVYYSHVGPEMTRFVDTEVEAYKTYYYMVTVHTRAGESVSSQIVDAIPGGPPGPPMDLVATPGDGRVQLSWSEPEPFVGPEVMDYVVYRGISPDSITDKVTTQPMLMYLDEGLENDITYYYRVFAININGNGIPSEVVEATPFRKVLQPGSVEGIWVDVDG
ncbi:MAG: hypothetical protein GWN18_20595, partial [Thermoplasmata archaeon]|nr:fibronectin type III domain-containing protein [Thermoplasmata archaeon]NIS14537.1 fibronectin type III domain-containing protein [Thermoplasmata archaeon]NIS22369.1 fibronectin type III domain-containing protein [Thermoplasmata archaeon]NIT80276.1 fibronectin type III domain-containing protein [Thermoplasmata archaeon]NIU51379.1 fibronectin type III domain-containing protein [Thermoplasmata archaeon]